MQMRDPSGPPIPLNGAKVRIISGTAKLLGCFFMQEHQIPSFEASFQELLEIWESLATE